MNQTGSNDVLSQRTDSLVNRTDFAVDSLLSRFTAIVEIATENESEAGTISLSTSTAKALQIENQANMLARAAEDLRQIIREVKEHWVLGERSHKGQLRDSVSGKTSDEASELQIRDIIVKEGFSATDHGNKLFSTHLVADEQSSQS